MSRWIRGRLGRPIASMLSVLMLVSFLLPLAPPSLQAQTTSDFTKLFKDGAVVKTPTPIVVLDFTNRSGYNTGMLGRTFSDALSIELLNTKTFDVIKRSQMEQVMEEFGLTIPLDPLAQAMVADRLKSAFTISGQIEDVSIHREKNVTYAEVQLSALVMSRVTKLPINGARVTQASSPKIGYSGNTDVLVHEALTTAAYQVAQHLLDNRLPIATVLTSPRSGEVQLKGGSTIGLREGMELTTIRRETVTGRLRLNSVHPRDSVGVVMEESKGIAPGDKAVPIFELTTTQRVTSAKREQAGLRMVGLLMLAGLGFLVSSGGGSKDMQSGSVLQPAVASLADAAYLNYKQGGNLLRWPSLGKRVVAYLIYRDTDMDKPIDIVEGSRTWYVDSGSTLPQQGDGTPIAVMKDVNVTIDPDKGIVEEFTMPIEYAFSEEDLTDTDDPTIDQESYECTTVRRPLKPGDTCGYMIRALYIDYERDGLDDEELGHPEQYQLFLGLPSAVSTRVSLVTPPDLQNDTEVEPKEGAVLSEALFSFATVARANEYVVQLASEPTFSDPSRTLAPIAARVVNGRVEADLSNILNDQNLPYQLRNATTLYWRAGARIAGQLPPQALQDMAQNGYVYSTELSFSAATLPPPPPSASMRNLPKSRDGVDLPSKGGKTGRTSSGTGRRRMLSR